MSPLPLQKTVITDKKQISDFFLGVVKKRVSGNIRLLEDNKKKISIRFDFARSRFTKQPHIIFISGFSELGLKKIRSQIQVTIEIVEDDKRIKFDCAIFQKQKDGIWIELPNEIVESERRTQKRIETNAANLVFFHPMNWKIDQDDISAPPLIPRYQKINHWIMVNDIHSTGFSLESRFPSFANWVSANPEVKSGNIHFPLYPPCHVQAELRWTKIVRDRSMGGEGNNFSVQRFYAGLKIMSCEKDYFTILKEFISTIEKTKSK